MTFFMKKCCIALLVSAGMFGSAHAGEPQQGGSTLDQLVAQLSQIVASRQTQRTPAYQIARPEVVSGVRMTVFANFLEEKPGVVLFDVAGTTNQCRMVDWRPNSVTFYVPKLGVSGGRNATIRVVKPNGRMAKAVQVRLVSQPGIVIHAETVGQPSPGGSHLGSGVFAGF